MHVLLMYSTHTPTNDHINRLQQIDPSIIVRVADNIETAIKESRSASIIFGHHFLYQCLPYLDQLRWVQSTSEGVDRLPLDLLSQKRVQLSSMTSFAPIIARHAISLAWAVTRCLPQAFQRQLSGTWDNKLDWLPWPRKAYIIGAGKIGCELARMLVADGLEVIGFKRTLPQDPASFSNFVRLYDNTSWRNGLPFIDWCFLALPNSDETYHLFDESSLRALPPHAVLINIGRGETLDTLALCRVLHSGHLGGAALDVIHPKLKGPEDPIWDTPRLVITPHCASHHMEQADTIERFCEAQLLRYITGHPVLNLINLNNL